MKCKRKRKYKRKEMKNFLFRTLALVLAFAFAFASCIQKLSQRTEMIRLWSLSLGKSVRLLLNQY